MKHQRGTIANWLVVPAGLWVMGMTAIPNASFAQSTQAQSKKAPAGESKGAAALTGCVDQQDGQYILVDDQDVKAVADLEADGFPQEAFAKHLGHKVTVRGTSSSGSNRPLFKVRSIEALSDTCAPQPPQ